MNDEKPPATDHFTTLLDHFLTRIDNLIEMFRGGAASVLELDLRFQDVERLTSELGIADDKAAEFVALWEQLYGDRQFLKILEVEQETNSPHETPAPTPEQIETAEGEHAFIPDEEGSKDNRDADIPIERPILEFLSQHGDMNRLAKLLRRAARGPSNVLTLAETCIVFAVGAFEALIAGTARFYYRQHKGAMGTGEKEFTLQELMQLGDIEAAIDEAVERRVESLCFGSLDDWESWFRKTMKIALPELALDFDSFRELIQRRHIIVHNDGIVSRQYVRRLGKDEDLIGKKLFIDLGYLESSLDQCIVLGSLMVSRAWSKLGQGEHDYIAQELLEASYDMLMSERWRPAAALAQEGMRCADDGSRVYLNHQVNSWIAKRELGEPIEEEVSGWNVDPLSAVYRVAKAALLDDFDWLAKEAPRAVDAKEIGPAELKNWPLFARLRSQPLFLTLLDEATEKAAEDDSSD